MNNVTEYTKYITVLFRDKKDTQKSSKHLEDMLQFISTTQITIWQVGFRINGKSEKAGEMI